MKTVIGLICVSVLACTLGVGCDSLGIKPLPPVYPVEPTYNDPEKIEPVNLGNGVALLLDHYFYDVLQKSGYYDTDAGFVMINNMDKLPTTDQEGNPIRWPNINFGSYTLIVGFHTAWDDAIYVSNQYVVIDDDEITLNLTLKEGGSEETEDTRATAPAGTAPYWGIYPKLPQLPIKVVYYQ